MTEADEGHNLKRIEELKAAPIVLPERTFWGKVRLWTAEAALLLGLVGIGFAYLNRLQTSEVNSGVQGSCQFWRDLSQLPLAENSSKVAFTIIADSRVAYARQKCASQSGELQPPDPRVAPLLPNGIH